MSKIQVLGTGCKKCKKLEEHTREAVQQLSLDAEVEKVTDIEEIVRLGAMLTPALCVDGEVVLSGKVPSPEAIAALLEEKLSPKEAS